MYKAIISDIDNTLVPIKGDGSNINSDTARAVANALAQSFHVSVATGRGWKSAQPIVQKLGLTDPCIIEGGSCIINPMTAQIIWQKLLDSTTSNQIAKTFKKYNKGSGLIKSSGKPERIPLQDVTDYSFENRVIYLLGVDVEVAQNIKEAIDQIPNVVANITTPSWAGLNLYDVHVTNVQGTKMHALLEWAKIMSLKTDEIIAMGDSTNDLPLFKVAGLKIAVGNATNDLKATADLIAPDCQNDALSTVINKYLLY